MVSSFTKYLYAFLTTFFLLISIIEMIAYNQFRVGVIVLNISLFLLPCVLLRELSYKQRTKYSKLDQKNKTSECEIITVKEKKSYILTLIESLIVFLFIFEIGLIFF